jgi:hypothetical protein
VGILSGLWVFSRVWLGSFVGCSGVLSIFCQFSWVLGFFPFSVSCCGLAFGVSCVYFLCTKGRLYAFLINLFLPIYIYIFQQKLCWAKMGMFGKKTLKPSSLTFLLFFFFRNS